jgi:hypothetical protein
MRSWISTVICVCVFVLGCGGRTLLDEDQAALGGDDGGRSNGSTTSDDSGVSVADALAPADAGPSAPSAIVCGKTSCDPASDVCCTSAMGQACTAKGTCESGLSASCSSAASCAAGQVCCLSFGGGGAATPPGRGAPTAAGGGFTFTVACESSCTAGTQLCASDAECPKGQTCQTEPIGGAKSCTETAAGFGMGGLGTGGFGGLFDGGLGGFGTGGFGTGGLGGLGGFGGLFDAGFPGFGGFPGLGATGGH